MEKNEFKVLQASRVWSATSNAAALLSKRRDMRMSKTRLAPGALRTPMQASDPTWMISRVSQRT